MVTNVNKYLLIITIVLIIFFVVIFMLYWNEEDTSIQMFLRKMYTKKMALHKQITPINPRYKAKESNGVIIVDNFLQQEYFQYIRKQFDNKKYESRDFVLRKASGVNFFNLHKEKYDGILELFYSNELLNSLSNIIGKPVQRVSLADPNACSLLLYTNKGDFIDWHLDYSSMYGDRFVVLLTLVNENANHNGLSHNTFIYNYKGREYNIKMKENSLIIFKGSEVLHKSTAIDDGERRILMSMVFCDICQEKKNVFNILYEKTKNYIIYGA